MARNNDRRPRHPPRSEGDRPADEEEGLHLLQGARHLGRLQGREPASQVHVGPGQDPRAACVGQLCAAPA